MKYDKYHNLFMKNSFPHNIFLNRENILSTTTSKVMMKINHQSVYMHITALLCLDKGLAKTIVKQTMYMCII